MADAANATLRPPYATDSQIRTFFERMKNMGEPSSVDHKWLESFNLGGSQPQAVTGLLKWLGIIDPVTGSSTGIWAQLRTKQSETLRALVEQSYEPVFHAVDVSSADREALNGAFIHAYQSGDTGRPLTAFLTLCSLAGIETPALQKGRATSRPASKPSSSGSAKKASSSPTPVRRTSTQAASPPAPARRADNSPGRPAVTLNVEIPGEWDNDRVRERIAIVLDSLKASDDS